MVVPGSYLSKCHANLESNAHQEQPAFLQPFLATHSICVQTNGSESGQFGETVERTNLHVLLTVKYDHVDVLTVNKSVYNFPSKC